MPAVRGVISDVKGDYPGNLTRFVLVTCIIAGTGSLIFGYDIGISGGVTSMSSFLKEFFPSVYKQQQENKSTNEYCQYDSETLTLFTSSLYAAALAVSLVATIITRKFLTMLCHLKFGLFLFFRGFVLVMSVFVYFFIPETKGILIKEMGMVWKKHWYWKRFVGRNDFVTPSAQSHEA